MIIIIIIFILIGPLKEKRSKIIRPTRTREETNNAKANRYSWADGERDHALDSRMAKEFALDVVSEETGVWRMIWKESAV